jgi:hypothetical protein
MDFGKFHGKGSAMVNYHGLTMVIGSMDLSVFSMDFLKMP